MGEQRYQELMSRLGQAFAQAGPQIREAEADSQAQMRREKEAQRQQWLERRAEAITQIQGWIDHYKLTREDLA